MVVANIVSANNLNVSCDFNVVKSLDDTIQGLPTLIVGWDYIKKKYPDYDIINRKISNNLYWTFKKTERRELHEEDIYNFIENSYKNLILNLEYIFVDPILFNRKSIIKILRKILENDGVIAYYHDKMIYIYCDKYIFGIDLSLLEFIGLNIDKIIIKIKGISKVFLLKDNIFIEYKNRIENLGNQVKYIPYLYSLENG
jgi:hypothetical protein